MKDEKPYFVDPANGCDETGDGTREKPYRTSSKAAQMYQLDLAKEQDRGYDVYPDNDEDEEADAAYGFKDGELS